MPRPSPFTAVLPLLALLVTPPTSTQEPAIPTVEASLDDIRRSLADIAASKRRQEETLRADVLLGRLEIAADELRVSESALRGAREQRESLDLELRTMERALEEERARMFRESPDLGSTEVEEQFREQLGRARFEMGRLREQLDLVDGRLIELENRVRDREVEHGSLRAEIDRILGLDGG